MEFIVCYGTRNEWFQNFDSAVDFALSKARTTIVPVVIFSGSHYDVTVRKTLAICTNDSDGINLQKLEAWSKRVWE